MSVLLPSGTLHVLSPQEAVDAHGSVQVTSWVQRGPYPCHRYQRFASTEELGERRRAVSPVQVDVDSAAWPIKSADRLLIDGGPVLEVQSARIVPDLYGAGIGHVVVQALEIAESV